MGIRPEVRYIRHGRQRTFTSREEARDAFRAMILPVGSREEELLERYLEEHLVRTTDENGDPVWKQDKDPETEWAFVAWDKAG